jgi:hypothetical protein
MRTIVIDVCTDDGWQRFEAEVGQDMIESCYQLPNKASRVQWWRWVTGLTIPLVNVRALVWYISR